MYQNITEVVKHLIIINVLMYFGTSIVLKEPIFGLEEGERVFTDLGRMSLASFLPGSPNFKPWQPITSMFMHGSVGHLFFNMLSLFFFGPRLEMAWGSRRFLNFYLITGLGAWVIATAFNYYQLIDSPSDFNNYHSLGASGAIFGILAGFAYTYPEERIMLLIPPIPMKAKYFVLIFGAIELYQGVYRSGTGIGHIAHVGGALVGFLLLVYWNRNSRRGW